MRSGSLDSAAVGGDEGLNGGGVETAGELLLLGLAALNDGHGQHLFVHAGVVVEDLKHFLLGLFLGGERAVAFLEMTLSRGGYLPEELAGADEGGGVRELPANRVGPLVQAEGEVAVTADPAGVG